MYILQNIYVTMRLSFPVVFVYFYSLTTQRLNAEIITFSRMIIIIVINPSGNNRCRYFNKAIYIGDQSVFTSCSVHIKGSFINNSILN